MWVVLIAGSTGSALRAVGQPSHHADVGANPDSRRECDGLLVALALGHHRPGDPPILLASAMAATFVGRLANNAARRCLVPWILA